MNREEYARMFAHEQTHWWYVGMRAISATLLDATNRPPTGDRLLPLTLAALPSRKPSELQDLSPITSASPTSLEILDAGCGTGAGMEWLAGYGRVTGIDLSPDALAFCALRQLDRLARASIDQLPFPDRTFDLVTSFDVLYHQWVAEGNQALAEFFRVLRPGGRLLVRVPAIPWLAGRHDAAVLTRKRYWQPELVADLQQVGFRVERATYVNTLLLPVVAGKRLVERWSHDSVSDLDATPGWLNSLFVRTLGVESRLVRRLSLPIGVSVMAVARRPAAPDSGMGW